MTLKSLSTLFLVNYQNPLPVNNGKLIFLEFFMTYLWLLECSNSVKLLMNVVDVFFMC